MPDQKPRAQFLVTPTPHDEAAAFIASKPVVSRDVFDNLLPELKARAFVVSGIESANVMQSIRDRLADLPAGGNWNKIKRDIADTVHPYIGSDDDAKAGAIKRAELLLRTHGFQAYQASAHAAQTAQQETFPFVQYATMEDAQVRPAHAALEGMVAPFNSQFVQNHWCPWDWGCRCQWIPMSKPDADAVQKEDEQREPDQRLFVDGHDLDRVEKTNILVRGPNQITDLRTPEQKGGGANAFRFNPNNLRISPTQLKARYLARPGGAQTWNEFETWAKKQPLTEHIHVWDWLNSKSAVLKKETYYAANLYPNQQGWSSQRLRADARTSGVAGQAAARIIYADMGISSGGPRQADVAAAEIASVGAARKALYHEQIGDLAEAASLAMQRKLPAGVKTEARDGHLIVYRPELVKNILDSDPSFYRPTGESDKEAMWRAIISGNSGEFLGYGARNMRHPDSVVVRIMTADGHLIAGFLTPRETAAQFAQMRGQDFQQWLEKKILVNWNR